MQILKCRFLPLALLVASFGFVACEVYYIVTSRNSPCFEDSCLTLSQFAANSTSYIDTNTTLVITGGSHNLDVGISVLNVDEFSMLSMNNTGSDSVITCNEHANFTFYNVHHIYISGLTFIGCDDTRVESVDKLTIEGSRFLGQDNSGTPLVIVECDTVNMTETIFLSNEMGRYQHEVRYLQATLDYPESFSARVGGALIVTHSTLTIDSCQFEGNGANIGGCLLYTSPSPRDATLSRMPSSA